MRVLIDMDLLLMNLGNWRYDLAKTSKGEKYQVIGEVIDRIQEMPTVPHACDYCLRQGCQHREEMELRINCPLFKKSAV